MKAKNFVLILLMALIWGTSFPVSKTAIDIIGPYAFRVAASFVSCFFVFLFFWKTIIASYRQISVQEWFKLVVIAVPNVFIVPTLNSVALHYTSVTNATILVYTMPCFTSLFLMLSARSINIFSVISLLLCLSGIFLVLKQINIGLGEIIILASAVIWAIGAILSQQIRLTLPFAAKLFWQIVLSSILVLLTYPLLQTERQWSLLLNAFSSLPVLAAVVYLGLFGSAVVYYIWFYLIQHENAEYASYAVLLSPIISVILSVGVMNESISTKQMFGFVLILVSAIVVNLLKPWFSKRQAV